MTSLRFAERLSDLVDGVEVILSDIWGVVHNGLESFPEACEALHTYRQRGGTVILITNAPRPLRPEGASATGGATPNKESGAPNGTSNTLPMAGPTAEHQMRATGNAALARRAAGPG